MDLHSQKYNPEVPTLQASNNERVQQLSDQLNALKDMVYRQVRIESHLAQPKVELTKSFPYLDEAFDSFVNVRQR